MARHTVNVSDIEVANDRPFVLFGGMNVLESRELAFEVAEPTSKRVASWEFPMSSRHRSTRPTARR